MLLVPGAGHSVLNHSPCAANAVRGWLNGTTPAATCTRFSLYVPPVGSWRRSVAATPPVAKVPGLAGHTLAALLQTIHDAEDVWSLTRHTEQPVNGLVAGSLTPDPNGVIRLKGYGSVAGLILTGNIILKMDPYGDPVVPFTAQFATLTVGGSGAARGRIRLSENRLTGTLARRTVSARF